jgi:flagellar basal-body rod protein FlgG
MSIQTLYTAATGMEAMQTKLNVIANNLANVNTTGFKRDRANFEDLFYRQVKLPGLQDAQGQLTPTGIHLGLGTRVASTQTEFVQGAFHDSQGELDMAIVGNGFFQVVDPNTSQILYTRAGNFSRNANGNMVMGSASTGRLLEPAISIPQDAIAVSISDNGFVEVQLVGQPQLQQIGQIQLASFINPQGLLKLGENLYAETNASGPVLINNPGTNGVGSIKQRMLEASNVEPVRELIDLITTQRSFELNSQAIQVGDQMLQLVANLRRF